MPPDAGNHGAPMLRLGGFELDIQGPTEHDCDDTWDATWVTATVRCASQGTTVTFPGIVMTSWSVARFRDGLEELMRSHTGCALLAAEGPELSVCVRAAREPGHASVRVDITPNRENQGHWFVFDLDAAAVTTAIAECRAILDAFPAHEMADARDSGEQSPA